MPGRFITLEGGEGVGKSTQARALAAALRARGLEVVETREPGGTEGAEAIRSLLLEGATHRWGSRAEALLFAAARSDHVERKIFPALTRDAWVISDRFLDSSRAYQGSAGAISDAEILALHSVGCGGFLPDRTLLLVLPEHEAVRRTEARDHGTGDRIARKGQAYHAHVAAAFASFAVHEPDRWRLVPASGPVEGVTALLLAALADLL